jgi:hypothetical protein
MIRTGFLIKSMGASQQAVYLVSEMNVLVAQEPNHSVCAFYRNPDPLTIQPLFALLSVYDAWSFDGIAIATDIDSAEILLKCPSPKKKFFYVWDMEWTLKDHFKFKEMNHIYNNPELELIARSESHYDIIKRLWKKPITIINEYNNEQIASFLKEQSEEI